MLNHNIVSRTCHIGNNTSPLFVYECVLMVRLKRGFCIVVTNKQIHYICLLSGEKLELHIESPDNLELVDGIWDRLNNETTTLTYTDRYVIYKNKKMVSQFAGSICMDYVFTKEGTLHLQDVEKTSSIMVKGMDFLNGIHRWMIETLDYIFILDKKGFREFVTDRDSVLGHFLTEKGDFDGMMYDYDGNEFHLSSTQDIIIYQKNNDIFIAQTLFPYQIYHRCFGMKIPRVIRWFEHVSRNELHFQTNKSTYILSMFPISFTASTSIETTFE
jgi:hypothetical protein